MSTSSAEVRDARSRPIDLVLVDDHEVVRVGLASALGGSAYAGEFRVVGVARTVRELGEVLRVRRPDVVVLDLSLGDGSDPAETVSALVSTGHRVLLYTIADEPRLLRRVLAAGPHALSRKAEPLAVTVDKLRRVARGETVDSPEVFAMIDGDSGFVAARLSAREREVLVLYVSGFEVPQIAARLYLTENSAKEYLRRVRSKYTEVHRPAPNKLDLLRRAIEDGIVPPIRPQ